jgi:hypothetical protein
MSDTQPDKPDPKPESLGDKLRLEEYKILRGEIELRATEQRSMERNVVLIAAAVYGFLLTPKQNISDIDAPFLDYAWYLPSVFSFLAFLRWRESVKMIEALATYLKQVEERNMPEKGWEFFLDRERTQGHLPIASGWYVLFWVITVVGPLVVAYVRRPSSSENFLEIAILIGFIGSLAVALLVVRRWRVREELPR